MLRAALNYLSNGYSVIPLMPRSKKPLIDWKEYQSRRASESEVREWFQKTPDANLGVVTGAISGVCVVDLDGPEGLESAKGLNLPTTVTSLTGRGKHLWYRNVEGLGNSVRAYPGIDIRGEGGFIVAPHSIHESGRRYRFLGPSVCNAEKLPPFPTAIFAEHVTSGSGSPIRNEPDWIVKALEEMTDGNIDNTLFRICSWFRNAGASEATCTAFVRPHADRCGASVGHLEEKIRNVWGRYEPKQLSGLCSRLQSSESSNGIVLHSPIRTESIGEYNNWKQSSVASVGDRTGYAKLDNMLHGGLNSTRLFTVAARTGTGKTNWLIGVSRSFCEAGKKVLFFSTETQFQELWDRYRATLSAPKEFERHEFFVCDSFTPSLENVEEAINQVKPDLFIFDHINHVGDEHHEISKFMQGLNWLKRKYDCSGIVAAQLNRAADWVDLKTGEKVTPRMSMIKGSGTIEQASSRVLLLAETRVTGDVTEILGNLDKNDRGPKGLIHFGLMTNPYRMVEL
jgi:hypothetical protein